MDVLKKLIPVAATPVFQAIFNFVGLLKLTPFAHWGWNEDISLPITYIVSTGSAAVACLWPAKKNRTKAILIAVGIVILLAALGVYTWVSTSPPKRDFLWFYDAVAYGSFFLTYIAFGFVVARVTKYFAQK
jgi:hypothetical protein